MFPFRSTIYILYDLHSGVTEGGTPLCIEIIQKCKSVKAEDMLSIKVDLDKVK